MLQVDKKYIKLFFPYNEIISEYVSPFKTFRMYQFEKGGLIIATKTSKDTIKNLIEVMKTCPKEYQYKNLKVEQKVFSKHDVYIITYE